MLRRHTTAGTVVPSHFRNLTLIGASMATSAVLVPPLLYVTLGVSAAEANATAWTLSAVLGYVLSRTGLDLSRNRRST